MYKSLATGRLYPFILRTSSTSHVIITYSDIMVLLLTLLSCRTMFVLSLYRWLRLQRAICCSSMGNRKRSPAWGEWGECQSGVLDALCTKCTTYLVPIIFVVRITCRTNPSGGCIQSDIIAHTVNALASGVFQFSSAMRADGTSNRLRYALLISSVSMSV